MIFLTVTTVVVFISSAGFVSVQHFCNMSGKHEVVQKTCSCDDNCENQSADNCISGSSCCFEKASYFINAVASFELKSTKTFFSLALIKFGYDNFSLNFTSHSKKDFLIRDKYQPPLSGRILLLQKSLLLI